MKIQTAALLCLVLVLLFTCKPKEETAKDIVLKSIAFHDPENKWPKFNDTLHIEMTPPTGSVRFSEVIINLPNSYFSLNATKDSLTATFVMNNGKCNLKLNGSSEFSPNEAVRHNLFCERTQLYKDYYEYLYGLPMKLMDTGTHLNSSEKVNFKGKDYLKVNVSYDKEIGSDNWNFYFNPTSYALEAYQFFKTDDKNGEIIAESGEYILLDGIEIIYDIKMPKNRKWYYNKDETFLGEDVLK